MLKQPIQNNPPNVEYWIERLGIDFRMIPPGIVHIPTPQQSADAMKISFGNYCLNAGIVG